MDLTVFNIETGSSNYFADGVLVHNCTLRPLAWWKERLPPGHEAVDKESLEAGAIVLPPGLEQGVKLNLGSFTHMFHGWRNVDLIDLSPWARQNGYAFTQWDLSRPLPYDDQVVDLIYLSHVLEHFDYAAGRRLLGECRRVLKPGGWLRVAVPDAERLIKLYQEGRLWTLAEICGSEHAETDHTEGEIGMLHELLYGGDHRAIYDHPALSSAVLAAGFTRTVQSRFGGCASPVMRRETIDLYPEMSLFVDAT